MAEVKKVSKTKKVEKGPLATKAKKQQTETEIKENKTEKKIETTSAKAGKRSAKALSQAEEKTAKQERKKTEPSPAESVVKIEQKGARSRIDRAGKKYRQATLQIEKAKAYSLAEAVELAIKTATTKFDSTIELHLNLAVDPKQADQNVRGTVVLPNGTGKSSKVAVFAVDTDAEKAKQAGADIVGTDEIVAQFEKGGADFDVLISTPPMMAQLGKYAKLLGPKGLMPNPKSGTVTNDISKAVTEAKAGKVEYRVDQAGIIHLGVGKASFGPQKLLENAQAIITSVKAAKPPSIKGIFIKSIYVTSSMGPSIRVVM